MENWEVAAALERMAGLLALKGEKDFKVRAYSQAARQVIRTREPVVRLVEEGRLQQLPGIGKALAAKIEELAATGRSTFLARLEEESPPELLALFSIPGVGYKTASALVQGLNLKNMAELEKAARAGRVARLPGLGTGLENNIRRFFQERHTSPGGFHRGIAVPLAGQLIRFLEEMPFVARVLAAGEIRRGTELVAEVPVVVVLEKDAGREKFKEALPRLPGLIAVTPVGDGFALENVTGLPMRLIPVDAAAYPTALAELTGSARHWDLLVERAGRENLVLTGAGLFKEGSPVCLDKEPDLYSALGLPHIPPELREDGSELAAAAEGRLPRLLEPAQVRGDLHLHTAWSDGTASIMEMAAAAADLGYAYIAVTDHSPSLKIAGGLSVERLRLQIGEIGRINRQQNCACHIFTGVEADILPGGSLDLPDDLLDELDVVIASVHSHFRQSRAEMTERICRAMEHPAVQMIGHPTGRLLGSRGGYQVDVEQLVRQAAATGTILEINASPQRLDLSEAYLRRARDAGVRLAINTDAHSTVTMEDMFYGVTAARRGWLESGDVINTLPLAEVKEALREKRLRKG